MTIVKTHSSGQYHDSSAGRDQGCELLTSEIEKQRLRTVDDFGDQWTRYTRNDGHYASQEMFADIVGPLLNLDDLAGTHCLEVGAGTGRISAMLLRCGAERVTAVEPSRAAEVLARNLAPFGDRVEIIRAAGHEIDLRDIDFAFSIGVLHHIPDPRPVVDRLYASLKVGGSALIWLYGREGNALYLAFAEPLRRLTRRLPVGVNGALAAALYPPLRLYIALCRWLPLPLRAYMREVLAPMSGADIRLVIVDQLNPAWAEYYSAQRARDLLERSGFVDVTLHHRHGYSWTVRGRRPPSRREPNPDTAP
ncbi:MAG TPA: class I SAM-dependent methyltransferase [Hyphomicrobium sp.]|mgnify:FL=1|nr:class I SAM-dependent methyltransferase [Hyphomicrobium sp.]